MTTKKWVYRFAKEVSEGRSDMKDLLGNKGANLAEMAAIGMPVPPGFTITTDVCHDFLENGHQLREEITKQISSGISWLEEISGRGFGNPSNPLLVSVRSGAAQSMPGMMDTVLNLGLNDDAVSLLLEKTTSKRFILDCYRRLIEMYGSVVLGVDEQLFDDNIHAFRIEQGLNADHDIKEAGWSQIIERYKSSILLETGLEYPQNIEDQLYRTIGAVFNSWYSPRAISYRAIQGMDDSGGTAVTIQLMVYGNRSHHSASGVAFTRDPSTGSPGLFGEFLPRVQGEDIVDGFHSPHALSEKTRIARGGNAASLQSSMPQQFDELVEIAHKLETRFRDMQEIEFTIDEGKLWLLQTRTAKRTIKVAVRIALDLLDQGLISQKEAIEHVPLRGFMLMTHPVIDPDFKAEVITRGLPASPGAASGKLVFLPEDAVALANEGLSAILVRNETSPNDIAGMHAARAILTRRGGMTSHAADIARAIGRPCIVDARFIQLDMQQKTMKVGGHVIHAGDEITIDGSNGRVLAGVVPMQTSKLDEYGERFKALLNS